jgi:hypothetical protein
MSHGDMERIRLSMRYLQAKTGLHKLGAIFHISHVVPCRCRFLYFDNMTFNKSR